MSLTPSEVENALEQADEDFYWDELGYYIKDSIEVDGTTYRFEVLDESTGFDGAWDIATHVVFKVGDQVFRKTGRYQSHYGNDWDGDLTEVKPVEKTITVWEDLEE